MPRSPKMVATIDVDRLSYAASRDWPFAAFNVEAEWMLADCWRESRTVIHSARAALDDAAVADDIVACVAVAGSLGRMEMLAHSDCDLLVFTVEGVDQTGAAVKREVEKIWDCLNTQGLRLPKSWGIFAAPESPYALVDPSSLGDLNESRQIFGKRIQTILDCQPLFGDSQFEGLQRAILAWYATAFVNDGDDSQWRYLINDLVRYYKSYSAWHQYKLSVEFDDSWYIRDSKLGTSRLVMFAGLLLTLASLSRVRDRKIDALLENLHLTPLERVVDAFGRHGESDDRIVAFISNYNTYFEVVSDIEHRDAMVQEAPTQIEDLPPKLVTPYQEIRDASSRLRTQLTEFIVANAYQWHPAFLETLLL